MSGLDGDDYATLASIEDHLRRIADALERAHPKFHPGGYAGGGYMIPEMPSCGYGRVVTRDAIRAELAGKPCDDRTCTDRDHWAPVAADPAAAPASLPTWADAIKHMQDGLAKMAAATPKLAADPLDESDHRPRHDHDGEHIYCHGPEHWHAWARPLCSVARSGHSNDLALNAWNVDFGPLSFCDCDDAATLENAPTTTEGTDS